MHHYWIYIVSIIDENLIILEGTTHDYNMKIKEYTKDEFKKHCQYSSISTYNLEENDEKYWVYFLGNDVYKTNQILRHYKNKGIGNKDLNRQIKIEEITYNI